jgi:hypothetical protein
MLITLQPLSPCLPLALVVGLLNLQQSHAWVRLQPTAGDNQLVSISPILTETL